MEIKNDKLQIYTGPVDRVGGAAPEPEERPAQRVMEADVPMNTVTIDDKARDGKTPFHRLPTFQKTDLNMDGAIRVDMTVGEAAEAITKRCAFCRWWDQEKLHRTISRLQGDTSKTALPKLNELRAPLLEHGLADLTNVDDILKRDLGLCGAFSSIFGEDIIAHRSATCPEHGPNGQLMPSMFRPRTKEAEREAIAARDALLRTAAGK